MNKELEADNYVQNNMISDYIDERDELIEKLKQDIKDNSNINSCYNISSRGLVEMTKKQYAQEILNMIE